MPRLPYLSDENLGPDAIVAPIRARRGGRVGNLDRQLLYSPPLAKGWNQFFTAVRGEFSLPGKPREIAMCVVATLNKAPYEFHHHAPVLIQEGGTPAQVEALRDVDHALGRTDLFDRAERATIRLTLEMTRNVEVSDATFAEARAALGDDRHVVELVSTIAAYNMVSRMIVALGIEPE
jgi:alkylhydroperoxidase family enzyme